MIKISYQDPFYLVCDVESSRTVGYQGMSVQWKRDSLIIVPLVGVEPDTLRYTGNYCFGSARPGMVF